MRKLYSLNYSLQTAEARNEEVKNIIEAVNDLSLLSPADLEQLGDYICFGKEVESGKSALDRKEILPVRKHGTWKRMSEKEESLDSLMENPLVNESEFLAVNKKNYYVKKHRTVERPEIDADGNYITRGHMDVPGMVQVWDTIDRLDKEAKRLRKLEREVGLDEEQQYRLYLLKHSLVDIRRDQYALLDMFEPTIHFANLTPTEPSSVNWSRDTGYWMDKAAWEERAESQAPITDTRWENNKGQRFWFVSENRIDLENSTHVYALISNYLDLLKWSYCRQDTDARALCWDFEEIVGRANLTDLRRTILELRIGKMSYEKIRKELAQDGIELRTALISKIGSQELPRVLAETAKRMRLEWEVLHKNGAAKECNRCHKRLPLHELYWGHNYALKDGWSSRCKACEKEVRILRGQSKNDQRYSSENQKVLKVQNTEGSTRICADKE